jgi:hypothetical protein
MIAVIVACLMLSDLEAQKCFDYCLFLENEKGTYLKDTDECICGNPIDHEKLNERRLSLPHKKIKIE